MRLPSANSYIVGGCACGYRRRTLTLTNWSRIPSDDAVYDFRNSQSSWIPSDDAVYDFRNSQSNGTHTSWVGSRTTLAVCYNMESLAKSSVLSSFGCLYTGRGSHLAMRYTISGILISAECPFLLSGQHPVLARTLRSYRRRCTISLSLSVYCMQAVIVQL